MSMFSNVGGLDYTPIALADAGNALIQGGLGGYGTAISRQIAAREAASKENLQASQADYFSGRNQANVQGHQIGADARVNAAIQMAQGRLGAQDANDSTKIASLIMQNPSAYGLDADTAAYNFSSAAVAGRPFPGSAGSPTPYVGVGGTPNPNTPPPVGPPSPKPFMLDTGVLGGGQYATGAGSPTPMPSMATTVGAQYAPPAIGPVVNAPGSPPPDVDSAPKAPVSAPTPSPNWPVDAFTQSAVRPGDNTMGQFEPFPLNAPAGSPPSMSPMVQPVSRPALPTAPPLTPPMTPGAPSLAPPPTGLSTGVVPTSPAIPSPALQPAAAGPTMESMFPGRTNKENLASAAVTTANAKAADVDMLNNKSIRETLRQYDQSSGEGKISPQAYINGIINMPGVPEQQKMAYLHTVTRQNPDGSLTLLSPVGSLTQAKIDDLVSQAKSRIALVPSEQVRNYGEGAAGISMVPLHGADTGYKQALTNAVPSVIAKNNADAARATAQGNLYGTENAWDPKIWKSQIDERNGRLDLSKIIADGHVDEFLLKANQPILDASGNKVMLADGKTPATPANTDPPGVSALQYIAAHLSAPTPAPVDAITP